MREQGIPSAVKLVTWRETVDGPGPTGTLEWSRDRWIVTGEAGWLIDEYVAFLPTQQDGPRRVDPGEGIPFLYAVYFSMRATYTWVALLDAHGNEVDRDTAVRGIAHFSVST